ncbi:MAG TPA: hypothetical protein VGK85_08765 [Myxococcaceae bacterium]
MTDEELIYLFAHSRDSDPVPSPAPESFVYSAIERLVELGVMPRPADADPMQTVISRARVACRLWLDSPGLPSQATHAFVRPVKRRT